MSKMSKEYQCYIAGISGSGKRLAEKYPFLRINKPEKSERLHDEEIMLDYMPWGWRKAFGEQMCNEIKKALGDDLENYRVFDIKEKFGELRWYGFGLSMAKDGEIREIIDKYVELSRKTCIHCGRRIKGDIGIEEEPICDACMNMIDWMFDPGDEGYDDEEYDDYVDMIVDVVDDEQLQENQNQENQENQKNQNTAAAQTDDVSMDIREQICDLGCENAIVFDDPSYDSAIIGLTSTGQIVYNYDLMVESLVTHDGMTVEEAIDFISYNTERSLGYMYDENKPIIMYPLDE